jgi:predicted phosphodiesterase
MNIFIIASLLFISDVQIDATSAYPDSIASIISNQIGNEHIYDCGDVVENGQFYEAQEYARYKELFPNTTPVPGNHDHYDGLSSWTWELPVDVMDSGVHVVGFDTIGWNNPSALSDLRERLTDDSSTILFLHHQIYSDNVRNGGIADRIRAALNPIIIESGVDLVISGHGHAYERHESSDITYLVIGGGGAPLDDVGNSSTQVMSASVHHWLEIDVSSDMLDCSVIGIDGSIIDSFSVDTTQPVPTMKWKFGSLKAMYR